MPLYTNITIKRTFHGTIGKENTEEINKNNPLFIIVSIYLSTRSIYITDGEATMGKFYVEI